MKGNLQKSITLGIVVFTTVLVLRHVGLNSAERDIIQLILIIIEIFVVAYLVPANKPK
ncbi:MAG: hypothetical protein ABF709_09440 [Leuconostoc pseudomesenteroides]|uniref:hypothetical protein n=1 Tax=Lactobacillaceae TaxID=33958 RepID=UPI001E2A082D|nr:hypothetical protein [Leuconostoc pseudomesenteroides]